MDEALRIKKYNTNNPVPNKEFVPDITACFYTSKKGVRTANFYHMLDGKVYKQADPKAVDYNKSTPSNYYPTKPMGNKSNTRKMLYIEYVRSDEMLVVRTIKIKGNKPDTKINRDVREWEWNHVGCDPEYEPEFYLFKGNSTPYMGDGNPYKPDFQGRYYNREFVKKLNYMMKWDMANISHHEWRDFFDIQQPSEGGLNYGSWTTDSYYFRVDQYKNMQPRATSKTEKELNELLKIDLKPISDYVGSCPATEFTYKHGKWTNMITALNWWVFETIDPDTAVLRLLRRSHGLPKTAVSETLVNTFIPFDSEWARIYLTKKGILCAENTSGEFVKGRIDTVANDWCARLLNPEKIYDHEFFKGKEELVEFLHRKTNEYRYDKEILDHIDNLYSITQIISLMRTPAVTLFIKDKNPMLDKYKVGRWTDNINSRFDITPTSKKEDYKTIFNMNKYQVEKISNDDAWSSYESNLLQTLFADEMSSWTNDETDRNFDIVHRVAHGYYRWHIYLSSEKGYYYPSRKHDIKEEMKNEAIKNFNICIENPEAADILNDIGTRLNRTWDDSKYNQISELWKAATTYDELCAAHEKIVKII